jgi:DNA-binding NarL/FixJ family response regulator
VNRGVLDPFVFAFRLNRRLPREVARIPAMRSALQEVLSVVDGQELGTRGPGQRQRLEDAGLTDREREILDLLGEAKTNKEIAQALFLSDSTVKVHVGNVLRKIGARTRTEAAIYAVTTRRHEALDELPASDQDSGPELTP